MIKELYNIVNLTPCSYFLNYLEENFTLYLRYHLSRLEILEADQIDYLTCSRYTPVIYRSIKLSKSRDELAGNLMSIDKIARKENIGQMLARANGINVQIPQGSYVDSGIVKIVNECIDEIKFYPGLAELITPFTKSILIEHRSDQSFGSEQRSCEIGEIRLINLDHPDWTRLRLIEAILHESLHNILGIFELQVFNFCSSGLNKVWVRSPWSGNYISLHSMTHAILIHFSLWVFYKSVSRSLTGKEEKEALIRMSKHASGFLDEDLVDNVLGHQEQVDSRMLDLFRLLQRLVIQQTGVNCNA